MNRPKKIAALLRAHRGQAIIVAMMALGIAYWAYGTFTSTSGETRYVTATAQKGSLVVSVTGSGQVSVSDQVDIKAKVSGDLISLPIAAGQEVAQGAIIARIDPTEAEKAVRDAQVNLETAQLSLEKLKAPPDSLSLTQSQNALDRAKESRATAGANLIAAYDDGLNSVSTAFLDLPNIMSGLQDLLFGTNSAFGATGQSNMDSYAAAAGQFDDRADQLKIDATASYAAARAAYDKNFDHYKRTTRDSGDAALEALVAESYETVKKISDSVKSANNLIQFYKDTLTIHNQKPLALAETHLASLTSYTAKTNTHLSALGNVQNSIKSSRDSIVNAERSITENTQSLARLTAGADALDLRSSTLSLQQRQNALFDARQKLADYYVRAPFSGTIAKVSVKRSDSVGAGTAIATLISHQKIAEISLNELDAARVRTAQKATLTFDALPDLTIAGEVAEIDSIGTVSQGVVTYTAKISFATDDAHIKPGMSVNAGIVTDVKNDVITVPVGAVKTNATGSYVEVLNVPVAESLGAQGGVSSEIPHEVAIVTGLSNDTSTEIVSGLSEGAIVLVRTITPSAQASAASQAPSLLGGGARAGAAAGAVRTFSR